MKYINQMKNIQYIFMVIALLSTAGKLHAQQSCATYFNDVTITKTVTDATCQSNGSIVITLSGDMGTLQGFQYGLATHDDPLGYAVNFNSNNTFSNVPPGVYDITIRAFCSSDNAWSSERTMDTVTVGGNYQLINASLNNDLTRKPFVGCNLGKIVLTIVGGNSDDFVFEIINAPSGVSLDTVEFIPDGQGHYRLAGDDYPEGNYEIDINDGCATRRVYFNLASISGFPNILAHNNAINSMYLGVFEAIPPYNTCNTVLWNTIFQDFYSEIISITKQPDYYRYFLDSMFEISLSIGDNIPDTWITWDSAVEIITLSNGSIYSDAYTDHGTDIFVADSLKMRANIRLKDCPSISHVFPTFLSGEIPYTIGKECTDYTLYIDTTTSSPIRNDFRFICYPYSVVLEDTKTNAVVFTANNVYPDSHLSISGLEYSTSNYSTSPSYLLTIKDAYGKMIYTNYWYISNPNAGQTVTVRGDGPYMSRVQGILQHCNKYTWHGIPDNACFPQDITIRKNSTGEIIYQGTADTSEWFPPVDVFFQLDTFYNVTAVQGNDTVYSQNFYAYYRKPDIAGAFAVKPNTSPPFPDRNYYCGEGYGYIALTNSNNYSFTVVGWRVDGGYSSTTMGHSNYFTFSPSTRVRIIDPSPVSEYTGKEYYPSGGYYQNFGLPDVLMLPGTYYIELWDTCSTDSPDTLIANYAGGFDASAFSYTSLYDTCAGLRIYPTGKLQLGGVDTTTNYRITSGPAGYDQSIISATDPTAFFNLVKGGTYKIGIMFNNNSYTYNNCAIKEIEIYYEGYDPFGLDPRKTAAYLCEGETVGHISVTAQYGKKPYTFSLWDGSGTTQYLSSIISDSAAYFHYGEGNTNYMIKIQDGCNSSFTQNVTVIDLASARIVYAPNGGRVCEGSPIQLNCVTLGVTSYYWEGPNGYEEETQNPVIPNAQLNTAGWYKVRVKPEFCGNDMYDSIYITVYTLPDKPTVTNASLRYCQNSVIQLTDTTGAASVDPNDPLRWYAPDSITVISSMLYAYTPGLFTYFVVSVDDITGCESEKQPVVISIDALAAPPTVTYPTQTLCPNTPFSIRVLPKSPHIYYKVYDPYTNTLLATSAVNSDTVFGLFAPATSSSFYVTAVIDTLSCESNRAYFYIQVGSAATVADVTNVNDTIICTATALTFTPQTSLANPTFNWYTSQTETIPFHTGATYTTPVLTADTIFYIGVSRNGYCENAMGNRKAVKVTFASPALSSMITLTDTSICAGTSATLRPSVSGVTNPVYRWYASQTATSPFYIGASYTTTNLAKDTTFYVSVSGDNYCENEANDRKEVTVSLLNPSTQGKDFYVSFGNNYKTSSPVMQIRIVAQKATTISFTYKNNPALDTSFTVAAGSVYTYNLTTAEKTAVYSNITGTTNKSLRIQSTENISVYALNQASATTDATFVLPVDVLGTEYYHFSYIGDNFNAGGPYYDGYTLVAIEDNTQIYENSALKVTLNSGEVYSYYQTNDMTGYHFNSSAPIAYFVTHELVSIPRGSEYADHLYEQMTPVNTWGKTFVVPVTLRGVERIRIVASQDGTKITQTGGDIITIAGGQSSLNLNRGQFVELEVFLDSGGCYIQADKPIGVASYLMGRSYSKLIYGKNTVGDPSLTVVPPLEQMIFSADIAPFIPTGSTNLTEHHVMIMTPTATRNQTTVTIGNSPPSTFGGTWTTGNGLGAAYSFYSMPLTNSTNAYHFENPYGLFAMGFGLGLNESYYYLSGASMQTLAAAFFVDDIHYLELDGDTLCADSTISFGVSGLNPPTGTPGYLKWFINGAEQSTHEDVLQWSTPLANGHYTVRIDVVDKCNTYSFETSFTVVHSAKANDIKTTDATVCYGTTATLSLTTDNAAILNPVYNWYASQTETNPFHTGTTYTVPNLTADTVFYIGISGTGYCENKMGERQTIRAIVNPVCAEDDTVLTSCDAMPLTINVLTNDNVHCTPDISIVSIPAHATAIVDGNNNIEYTATFSGVDTLVYELTCGAFVSTAKVFITVDASGSAFVDDVWYFGRNTTSGGKSPGIRFVKNSLGEYEAQDASGESWVSTSENTLVVSSPYCNGQTIFYSSHNRLYNSLHDTMQNGLFAGNSSVADGLAACYMGDNKYLFFTITKEYDANPNSRALLAYVIDMNADNGKGARGNVISIEQETPALSESLELVAKEGTTDQYWLIYAWSTSTIPNGINSNVLRVRSVDVNNPNNPIIGTMPKDYAKTSTNYSYTLKVSPQNDKVALTHNNGALDIFDFKSATGELLNRRTVTTVSSSLGLEFSPDGNQVYAATWTDNYGLVQYSLLNGTPVKVGSTVLYGTNKGGGLKLGPDGKIYVTRSETNTLGVISNPNDVSIPLMNRYSHSPGFTLGVSYSSLQLPAGLTKPAVMTCNLNNAPITQADSTAFCVSTSSRTTTVNVLLNDEDIDGDTVYLTNADFVNASDTALAGITVSDSNIILTVKPSANIPATGHLFEIIYDIKDNGLSASQCATGILKIQVYTSAIANDITITDTSICYGTTANLILTTDNASIPNPVYHWYASQMMTEPFHTGSSYTTSNLTTDSTFYISISGDNYCENDTGERKAVTVMINPVCAEDDHVAVTCETDTIQILLNDIIDPSCASLVDVIIVAGNEPVHGTAIIDNQTLIYTYTGIELAVADSLVYEIRCGKSVSTAKVYFSVSHVGSAFVDDIWYFGQNDISGGKSPGIRFVLDGSGKYIAQDASNESWVNSNENSLVVSSPYCDGQNIFYSSHDEVYNSSHQLMLNGSFMGHSSVSDGLAACYMGNNKYLFFSVTTAYEGGDRGLKAYVVDMNADNGRGELVDSIEIEQRHANMSESIELISKDGTANQYWLVYAHCNNTCNTTSHYNDELRVRPIDVSQPTLSGIIGGVAHVAQKTASNTFTLKTSQQHNRIAIINWAVGSVEVFNFNNSTGSLTNKRIHTGIGDAYGVEFSPDGTQLYVAGYYGTSAKLYQYTISESALTPVGNVQYWNQTRYNSKGGGLKLGPDDKIYVMLYYSNKVGVISNPNWVTPLASRYDSTALELSITYTGLQFSTGLTKPALMACNMNNPPITQADSIVFCVSASSRSVTVDVLTNDEDLDVNKIYITGAYFVNISDTTLATLAVNATSDSIILTLKPTTTIPDAGYLFRIMYDVKDNGLPASQCATGLLSVQTYKVTLANDISISDETICYNTTTTLTPSAVTVINPVVYWYASQIAENPFYTGSSYTTSNLTTDSTFYIAISGENYCENDTGSRKAVTVTVNPELMGGNIGTAQEYCYGITPLISLGISPALGGSGNYSYVWEISTDNLTWNPVGVTTQDYSLNSALTQTTLYRRSVTDICGTVYSDTLQITILPLPVVSAVSTNICVGTSTLLSPTTDGTWTSNDEGIVSINNNNTAVGVSSGTATLTFTSSITQCSETVDITVREFPNVDEITGEKTVCIGSAIQLSNATSGGIWTSNNNNVSLNNPNANPVTVTGESQGTTYVTYTVSDGVCQTKRTYPLKITTTIPPEIIIGFER